MADQSVPRIEPAKVMDKINAGEEVVILDVRSPSSWAASEVQIKGSRRIPADDISEHLDQLPQGPLIVSYCTCHEEASSSRVARFLLDHGFSDARALKGGIGAWENAGYPMEAKTVPVGV